MGYTLDRNLEKEIEIETSYLESLRGSPTLSEDDYVDYIDELKLIYESSY